MSAPTKVQIAEALGNGVSRQAITKFEAMGMPVDSIEAAQAWYNARRAARGADASAPDTDLVDDDTFEEIVSKHRALKQRAYEQYEEDLANRDKNQAKSYATYDKLVKTLVALEREKQARDIASRKYIESQLAASVFGKVLLAVRNEINQLGQRKCHELNPDNPGLAQRVMDEEAVAILTRLSTMEQAALANVKSDEQPGA